MSAAGSEPMGRRPGSPDGLADFMLEWSAAIISNDVSRIEAFTTDDWVLIDRPGAAAFGLAPTIVPPFWHRHDELVWELSALHTHWLACHHETASPSDPIAWLRDFSEAKTRLRDWVATCGTRLDRDRPTRQTSWPGETPDAASGEVEIVDRDRDLAEFVADDLRQRRRIEALVARKTA